jgi:hypothetical protein
LNKHLLWILLLFAFPLSAIAQYDERQFRVNENPSFYFPGGIYSDFETRWYSKHLKVMGEPSLRSESYISTLQIYRFTWLRTFHHPVAVRLTIMKDGTGELFAKLTSGAGGYEPGLLIENRMTTLTSSQVKSFLNHLNKSEFWEMTSKLPPEGEDGAQWIIEGVKNRKYHLVDRWCPKPGEFREAAITLINLSGLQKIGIERY